MKKFFLGSLFLVLCITVVGCGKKKDPIVGKWAYGTGDSFVYTFNEDKTCHYSANDRKCTYTINGDKLSILYDGDTAPFDTTFKIEDNKLTIVDSFGSEVVYNKR